MHIQTCMPVRSWRDIDKHVDSIVFKDSRERRRLRKPLEESEEGPIDIKGISMDSKDINHLVCAWTGC